MTQNRPSKSDHRESGVVQRMRNSVRQLPVESPHVLLACSAGKDSVALSWILVELRRLGLLSFSIAHIHHGQHTRADLAADAVVEIGRLLDVSVTVRHLDQDEIDAHTGVGLEEAMRRERYLALSNVATAQSADCIALGHHQTDQAETILLHLMRGTGIDGLAGMREWESRKIPWWDGSMAAQEIGLWRPFIGESVSQVTDIARQSGLPVVEDPTNTDTTYRRNAIRNQLLPVLEDIAEGATAAISRSASLISAEADLLKDVTDEALGQVLDGDQLSRPRLIAMVLPLRKRVVRQWITEQLPLHEMSEDRVMAIVHLAERNRGGSVIEIGSGHRVTLRHGLLSID